MSARGGLVDLRERVGVLEQGSVSTITRTAGQVLSGHRAVLVAANSLAYLANNGAVVGLTIGAVEQGAAATIQTAGPIIEPSWNWLPGAVWIGPAGVLTQILPTTGQLVQIGVSAGPTTIIINPRLVAQL